MLKETLELKRFIKEPIKDNILRLSNHFGRYYYAIKKLDINNHDEVLDISCGEGYGSHILSQYAGLVWGTDINDDNLEIARNKFENFKTRFIGGGKQGLGFPSGMTKVICIETLEHMEDWKQSIFLKNIIKCLSYEGQLYLTFPIGENKKSEYNQYHICEPSLDYVYSQIKDKFKKIEFEINEYKNDYNQIQKYCIMIGRK